MRQQLSIRKPLTSCPITQRNNSMPLYYFIIASVPLFLLLLPVMSPAAAASGGGDATTSAVVGTSKQQLQRVDDQGVDGPFSVPEELSIAGEQQQQKQDEAIEQQKKQQQREQEVEKQQLHATTSCDIHNNEPLHALMDRICELCHDMYSHRRPNMRAECRSDCFRSVDFKRCLRLFRPMAVAGRSPVIGQQNRGFRHWVEAEDATLFF